MIGSKVGAAGANRSCRQSTKRKLDTKRDPRSVAGVSGEWKGVAGVKFFGVRDSSIVVEIKNYVEDLRVYTTVKEGKLVAAIIYDVFRLSVNLSYPEEFLNISNVELCILKEIQKEIQKEARKEAQKEAQIELTPIGKTFLVEFMKRHSVKLSDKSPGAQFPLKFRGLTEEKFGVLKEKIINLGRQCFRELEEKIIRDYAFEGRKRMDVGIIPPHLRLPEDNGDIQALKDLFAKQVAELAPSIGKSMFCVLLIEYLIHLLDENQATKSDAVRNDFITHFQVELRKLESALHLKDGALFYNRYAPQV